MFKNNEPPVSLFAFQDIITSLTGIMVFFLLLLALHILENPQRDPTTAPIHQEISQVKEINRVLKKQISEIQEDIKSYRERIKLAVEKDESTLIIECHRLENYINNLKRQRNIYNQKKENAESQIAQLNEENKKLQNEQKEIEKQAIENENLKNDNKKKKNEIEEMRQKIKQRGNEIIVNVDASINKIPIIIECSIKQICVLNMQDKTRQKFLRQTPILPDLVNDVISYLQRFPKSKYYFVFMIKPSAVDYFEYLKERFKNEFQGADVGYEPILEHEGVANE